MRKTKFFCSIAICTVCVAVMGIVYGCGDNFGELGASQTPACTWDDGAAAQFYNADLELPVNSNNYFPSLQMYFPAFSISTLVEQMSHYVQGHGGECIFTLTTSVINNQCTDSTYSGSKSVNQDNYTDAFGMFNSDVFEGVQMVDNATIPMHYYKFQICLQIKGVMNYTNGSIGTLTWKQTWPSANGAGCTWLENPLTWILTFPSDYTYATFHATNNIVRRIIYIGNQYVELL